VIAGEARGVPLKAPRVTGLRPTSDLVRGAIFDILGQFFDPETRVLDLYAGTGALGIEALSRGAGWADFVERQPRCCEAIRKNLKATGLQEQGKVFCASVERTARSLAGPYALLFMDPPYAQAPDVSLVEDLLAVGALQDGSRVVIEHARQTAVPDSIGALDLLKQRRHGDTVISVFGARSPLPLGEGQGEG